MEKKEEMKKYITLSILILLNAFCAHAQQTANTLIVMLIPEKQ